MNTVKRITKTEQKGNKVICEVDEMSQEDFADLEDIKRLAGILDEQEYGLGADETHLDKVRRLIQTAMQANQSGDTGQVGYILRELFQMVQEHESAEMGSGEDTPVHGLAKHLGLQVQDISRR